MGKVLAPLTSQLDFRFPEHTEKPNTAVCQVLISAFLVGDGDSCEAQGRPTKLQQHVEAFLRQSSQPWATLQLPRPTSFL